MSVDIDGGPKKTGDPEVDNTALIFYVAPQLTGERPLREGDQELINKIGELQRQGKLTVFQKTLLTKIGFFTNDGDLF